MAGLRLGLKQLDRAMWLLRNEGRYSPYVKPSDRAEIWRKRGHIHLFLARVLTRLGQRVRAQYECEQGLDCRLAALGIYQRIGDLVGAAKCLRAIEVLRELKEEVAGEHDDPQKWQAHQERLLNVLPQLQQWCDQMCNNFVLHNSHQLTAVIEPIMMGFTDLAVSLLIWFGVFRPKPGSKAPSTSHLHERSTWLKIGFGLSTTLAFEHFVLPWLTSKMLAWTLSYLPEHSLSWGIWDWFADHSSVIDVTANLNERGILFFELAENYRQTHKQAEYQRALRLAKLYLEKTIELCNEYPEQANGEIALVADNYLKLCALSGLTNGRTAERVSI